MASQLLSLLQMIWAEEMASRTINYLSHRIPLFSLRSNIFGKRKLIRTSLWMIIRDGFFSLLSFPFQIPLWIRPYRILVTGHDSGMIEPILDTMSLHQVLLITNSEMLEYIYPRFLRMSFFCLMWIMSVITTFSVVDLDQLKKLHNNCSLLAYFEREFGSRTSEAFLAAQKNFVESCAAYSILSYLIQIKDRHNGSSPLIAQLLLLLSYSTWQHSRYLSDG